MIDQEQKEGKVSLREYQLFQLDIVREFMCVCEKHGLRYWAAYGTLLGAARHQGFIPWDDDIDLFMPMPDYLRFREACKESLSDGFYLQVHSENPCNYINWQRIGMKNSTSLLLSHADIHAEWGVCIDIFPLSACPDPATKEYEAYLKKWERFCRVTKKHVYKHDAKLLSGLSKLYHLLMAAESDEANAKRWARMESELLNWCGEKGSNYLASLVNVRTLHRAEWFDDTMYLTFEDLQIPVPARYAEILSFWYGEDWMELPPEEKRVWHSGGGSDEVIVSLTEPYANFLR